MSLTDGLETYVCFILTVEFIYDYIWNTRENRLKRRKAIAKKESKNLDTASLPSSSHKKDVALVAGETFSPKEGPSASPLVDMCVVCERVHENSIHFQERSGASTDGWGCGSYKADRKTTEDV